MKLNIPVSGVYKITNIVTGKVYVGESINVQSRISSHFVDLSRDRHVNLEMQHDFDTHGGESFKYELLEKIDPKKEFLRAKESEYIELYTKGGILLYNGENEGFLHVKQRRLDRKNEQRRKPKRKVLDNNTGNVSGQSELFGTGANVQSGTNNNLESSNEKTYADVVNAGNSAEGADRNATTKRSQATSVDENGQFEQGNSNTEETLSTSDDDYYQEKREALLTPFIQGGRLDDFICFIDEYFEDAEEIKEIHKATDEKTINLYFDTEQEQQEMFRLMDLVSSSRKRASQLILSLLMSIEAKNNQETCKKSEDN